jgi:hypothetical protein
MQELARVLFGGTGRARLALVDDPRPYDGALEEIVVMGVDEVGVTVSTPDDLRGSADHR